MGDILSWLEGGDIRSDGLADELVPLVKADLDLVSELLEGLFGGEDLIRGRASDVLEKVARSHPEVFIDCLPRLKDAAAHDPVPMVRWHIAMLLGHLLALEGTASTVKPVLLGLLHDQSVFTASWAVVSLVLLGRKYPEHNKDILSELSTVGVGDSIALRRKVEQGTALLLDPARAIPPGWIKSEALASELL